MGVDQISILVSTFGGGGILIWYLLNERQTIMKELLIAIKQLSIVTEKSTRDQNECIDDLTIGINNVLDIIMPGHNKRRQTKNIRERIDQRRAERQKEEAIQKLS